MSRLLELLRSAAILLREQFWALTSQSERTILLGLIMLASMVSGATGFVLAQYYTVDVLDSIFVAPQDCFLGWPINVGRHCFNDYTHEIAVEMRPNPWEPHQLPPYAPTRTPYTAAAMVPQVTFGLMGKWLAAPRLGLLGYVLVLTIAVLAPAMWAARGARGLERVVVFMACGFLAFPAWFAVDRGNSVGFVVPIALAFLVALCRQQWGLVTITVVLASLVKPQFAVLVVVLLAARKGRLTGVAVATGVVTNIAAYLLWPRDFPQTIVQSVHNLFSYDNAEQAVGIYNSSFAKALLWIPDTIAILNGGGRFPHGFLAGPRLLFGYTVLLVIMVSVLALGQRISPVMAGIVLLATASLFPAVSYRYYMVFALPIAALVVRDPDGPPGSGIFDRLTTLGDHRRAIGICVTVATALTIVAPIALPGMGVTSQPIAGQPGVIGSVDWIPTVPTSEVLNPLLWLIACTAIIISYARRPASQNEANTRT